MSEIFRTLVFKKLEYVILHKGLLLQWLQITWRKKRWCQLQNHILMVKEEGYNFSAFHSWWFKYDAIEQNYLFLK